MDDKLIMDNILTSTKQEEKEYCSLIMDDHDYCISIIHHRTQRNIHLLTVLLLIPVLRAVYRLILILN